VRLQNQRYPTTCVTHQPRTPRYRYKSFRFHLHSAHCNKNKQVFFRSFQKSHSQNSSHILYFSSHGRLYSMTVFSQFSKRPLHYPSLWRRSLRSTAAIMETAKSPPPPGRRSKSSINTSHLASWQKGCWTTYLANGLGSDNLFRSIDTDNDSGISAQELQTFFESVNYKGVHPRAFKMIHELASDHVLDNQEFKSWLILATKFGAEKNSVFALNYATRYPDIGERKPQTENDDANYYSWNSSTMSQAVRRMQYAVRGQIVMRADEVSMLRYF
jgi:hypothetical protein